MTENPSLFVAHHSFNPLNITLRALIEKFSVNNSVIEIVLTGPKEQTFSAQC